MGWHHHVPMIFHVLFVPRSSGFEGALLPKLERAETHSREPLEGAFTQYDNK